MRLAFVYESRTESNPERTDSPTHIRPDLSADPDPVHLAAAVAALDQDRGGGARVGRIAVSPWSKLSSGSVFSPEFPRPVVALFNWAFGAIVLLALLQLALDVGLLVGIPFHGGIVSAPDGVRYGLAALAAVAAAIGVHQAMRIPPLKDIEIGIRGLPHQFDGYTILQLTDLHISRLFPASWARAVVERSNKLGVDLIAITGDLIDGTLDARRTDIEPLRDLKATDGVYVISGNHEYIFGYSTWMAHFAAAGTALAREQAHRSRSQRRQTGSCRHHRPGVAPHRTSRPRPCRSPRRRPRRRPCHPARSSAERRAARRSAWRGSSIIRTYARRTDPRDRPAGRTRQRRLCLRSYDVDGMTLYVNNGTALWPGFALRLGRPSELTRITLRQARAT